MMTDVPGSRIAEARSTEARSTEELSANAACRFVDPEFFFPSTANGETRVQVARAKRVCGACPVREQCLREALLRGEQHGIWGGLTPHERRGLGAQVRNLRSVPPELIRALTSGQRCVVSPRQRPGVVLELLLRGWNEARIARALLLDPAAVRLARLAGERAMAFLEIEPVLSAAG